MLNKQVNEPTSEGRKGEMTKEVTRQGTHTVRLREVLTGSHLYIRKSNSHLTVLMILIIDCLTASFQEFLYTKAKNNQELDNRPLL